MKIKFIGTGTSHGVPVIGCSCAACSSKDPRNTRYRSSVWIEDGGTSIVIDTPAEFRVRTLEYAIKNINAVLFTHAHADHAAGLDDVRVYNEIQGMDMPVYGDGATLAEIKQRYSYIFTQTQEGGGKPRLDLREALPFKEFKIKNTVIKPLKVSHGEMEILGFKINNDFAYITDCSFIPEETFDEIKNIKVLVLDALRHKPHPTHFSLGQAIDAAKKSGAAMTYFTHISHGLEHVSTEENMLQNTRIAYDGLTLIL